MTTERLRVPGALAADRRMKEGLSTLISLLSRDRRGQKLVVFVWHRLLHEPDPTLHGTDEHTFCLQLDRIGRHFDVLPLRDAVSRCQRRLLQRPTAAITFDDGYLSQRTIGARRLAERGMPASFFVTSGHIDGRILWNDRLIRFASVADENAWSRFSVLLAEVRGAPCVDAHDMTPHQLETLVKYLPLEKRESLLDIVQQYPQKEQADCRIMDETDVLGLHQAGFEIGAHTLDHPILLLEELSAARRQISVDIDNLAAITGEPVKSFAFPNGMPGVDYSLEHVDMLNQCGIEVGLTSALGHFGPHHDRLQVPRVALGNPSLFGFLRSIRSAYSAPNGCLVR